MINWLRRRLGAGPVSETSDEGWGEIISGKTSAGVRVSQASAHRLAIVYACVKIISETCGQLPLAMFRRFENGDKELVDRHPLQRVIHDQFNDEITAQEGREIMTTYALMRGTAFAEKIPGPRGPTDQLIPLHPDHYEIKKVTDSSGRVRYFLRLEIPGEPPRNLRRDQLFIFRNRGQRPDSPWEAFDPIMLQKESIASAIAARDYGSQFFANDARFSLLLTTTRPWKQDGSKERFLDAFRAALGRHGKRHGAYLLEPDMDAKTVSVTQEQAQFLETRKYHDVDIAAIFGMQMSKLQRLENAHYANIEHESIAFVQNTMLPWLRRWEHAIARDLIIADQRFFAEHNVLGLLRGDVRAQAEAFAIGRNWGWWSVNDIRRKLNENSIGDAGDRYLEPLNMVEAGEPGEPSGQGQRRNDALSNGYRMNGGGLLIPESFNEARVNGAH